MSDDYYLVKKPNSKNFFLIEKKNKVRMKPKETTEGKIKKSLRYSVFDASFYSAMVGFGESFFSAFAVFLQASTMQLGLLGSLPQAIGSMSQLFSQRLLKFFGSRKRFVCFNAFLQALMYIPIALVFFLGNLQAYHLILFVCLYFLFGVIPSSAWTSWIGDLVPEYERGSYFGRRNTIAGFISFFTLLMGGFVLEKFVGDVKTQYTGFAIIFIAALFFRLVSLFYLLRQYEPKYNTGKDDGVTFIDFLKKSWYTDYGYYILFLFFMNFSVYIAGPFFAAYMLYDLKLSYIDYTIVLAAAVIAKYFSMPIWGKFADKYGTRKVLTLSGYLMPLVSILWIFSSNIYYLILIQMYSGFVWAGFEIASFNFLFETILPNKRAKYISYLNVLNGAAFLVGALIGGLLVKYNSIFWSKYLLVFIISTVFRYGVAFVFIPRLKEVRRVDRITYPKLLMDLVTTMTTRGLIYEILMFNKKKR